MATTKTIQPTGATITIPEFTDQPDIRPVATDLSNITDAANALNDQMKWTNVPITAAQGTFTNASCKRTGNTVFASIEISGPVTAYQTFVSGFPRIDGMYYGEFMDSDASTRIRFYIQSDGQWFLRASLPEGKTVRTTIMAPTAS